MAEAADKAPLSFDLTFKKELKNNPVGKNNEYDPDQYTGVLKLVRQKSDWYNSSGAFNNLILT